MHKGYGVDTIQSNYTFNYCSTVNRLVDDITLLSKSKPNFYKSYVMDGLSDKAGGHSYMVDVVCKNGVFYATIFDSVKRICPAFVGEIGNTFKKVMINNDSFQHSFIGCRGFALDTNKILVVESAKAKIDKTTYNYYRDYIYKNYSDDNSQIEINEYRKDLFDAIVEKKKKIFSLEKELKIEEQKIEDRIVENNEIKKEILSMEKNIITKEKELKKCVNDDIAEKKKDIFNIKKELKDKKQKIEDNTVVTKKIKKEIPSIQQNIMTKEKELKKYVKDEIKKDGFDITKFIINRKDDVKKFTPQQIIDQIFLNSKNIYTFDVYHPQMTHLIADYKTLRKHILHYHNNANKCDEALKDILELEKILPTLNTPEKLQEYKKLIECKKQNMGNNDPKYIYSMAIIKAIEEQIDMAITKNELLNLEGCQNFLKNNQTYIQNEHKYHKDAMKTIKSEIERGIKHNCFNNKDSWFKVNSKADEIIAQIIKNPDSKYCFSGYKRREASHVVPLKPFSWIAGYNPESHSMGR